MYQLRGKKILPILLPSMVEAKNFSDHPRTKFAGLVTVHRDSKYADGPQPPLITLIIPDHYAFFFILLPATLTGVAVTEPRPPALPIYRLEMTAKRHVTAEQSPVHRSTFTSRRQLDSMKTQVEPPRSHSPFPLAKLPANSSAITQAVHTISTTYTPARY